MSDITAAIHARFPDPHDRQRFFRWNMERNATAIQEARTPVDKDAFVQQVDSIDFRHGAERTKLVEWMLRDVRPWVPLGRDHEGTAYRLMPEAYGLRPQQPDAAAKDTHHDLLPLSLLGVNTTVQPKQPAQPANRRKENLSEVSTRTAESDDDPPGFEFHQLGILEEYGDDLPDNMAEAAEGPWHRTGFYVVARLGNTGRIDGVYIIFDMFPTGANGQRRQITDANWGMLAGDQFS
ncbi:hypothetical protein SLS54_009584, partial [Diplodia seriata]